MYTQIAAIVIFIAMFIFIVSEKIERHIVTLTAGLLTIVFVFLIGMHSLDAIVETLNIHSIFTVKFWYVTDNHAATSTGVNWETIFFIAGMMVMVEGMAEAGFFRWLCLQLAGLVRYRPVPIFITFMIMSAFLSMFIDSTADNSMRL